MVVESNGIIRPSSKQLTHGLAVVVMIEGHEPQPTHGRGITDRPRNIEQRIDLALKPRINHLDDRLEPGRSCVWIRERPQCGNG